MFADVYLYVIPTMANDPAIRIKDYDPEKEGSKLSDSTKIIFNKLNSSNESRIYSIVYNAKVFAKIPANKLLSAIIRTFVKNVPDSEMHLHIRFNHVVVDDNDNEDDLITIDSARSVTEFLKFCAAVDDRGVLPMFKFDFTSTSIEDDEDDIEDDDDDIFDRWVDEQLDEDDDDDDNDSSFHDPFEAMGYEFKLPKKEKGKKSKDKKSHVDDLQIYRSKVFRNSKNPKREISRHGVLIANKKSDIEKDREILKDVLKAFIPGDKTWIKKFRKELLDRWMVVYVITKKSLKRKEHEYRQAKRREVINHGYDTISKSIGLTSQIISHATDKWNDPRF